MQHYIIHHFVYSLLSFCFLFYHRSKVLPGGVQLPTVFLFFSLLLSHKILNQFTILNVVLRTYLNSIKNPWMWTLCLMLIYNKKCYVHFNKESFCKMDSLFPEIGQQLSRLTLSYAEAWIIQRILKQNYVISECKVIYYIISGQ